MRIVCVSDTHGHEPMIPDGDLLIHAGDLCLAGTLPELNRAADWLGSLPHRHKIVVAGNHDWPFSRQPNEARAIIRDVAGAVYLQDSFVEVEGLKVWGAPWQPEFAGWAFNLPRGPALAEKWAMIPDDTDVLVTHGPPAGILDMNLEGERCGCRDLSLRLASRSAKPRLHVFGHIHEGHGVRPFESVLFVNASVLDDLYNPKFGATVVEL